MKYTKIAGGLLLALTLAVSTAFAGNKPASVELRSTVGVNGQQLPAGSYTLKWEGNGPAVEVQFLKGKKVVASAPAQLEQLSSKNKVASALVDSTGDAHNLLEVRFEGKNYKLVFPSAESQAQNARGSGTSAQTNR